MYTELWRYFRAMRRRTEFWKDGEFITALVGAVAAVIGFVIYPNLMDGIRKEFGSLLSVASIVFGFALTTLTFYISAVAALKRTSSVKKIADKLVDWHVWTILCLLFLIGWIVILWVFDVGNQGRRYCVRIAGYVVLVFLVVYCAGQIVNHALTLWWFHHRRSKLQETKSAPSSEEQGPRDQRPSGS